MRSRVGATAIAMQPDSFYMQLAIVIAVGSYYIAIHCANIDIHESYTIVAEMFGPYTASCITRV